MCSNVLPCFPSQREGGEGGRPSDTSWRKREAMRSQRENICLMVAVQVPQEQQAAGMVIGAPSVRRNLIISTAKSARISGWLLCYVPLLCSGLCVAWRRGEDRSAIRLSYQILISQYSLILTHLKKQNKKNQNKKWQKDTNNDSRQHITFLPWNQMPFIWILRGKNKQKSPWLCFCFFWHCSKGHSTGARFHIKKAHLANCVGPGEL